mmetsp:Transcript_14354/g.36291  ORF Transcript_14354/g.36291 Transcript_14354/m.36291 type:complete len:223 (+) Transcript_14354:301-969(+)
MAVTIEHNASSSIQTTQIVLRQPRTCKSHTQPLVLQLVFGFRQDQHSTATIVGHLAAQISALLRWCKTISLRSYILQLTNLRPQASSHYTSDPLQKDKRQSDVVSSMFRRHSREYQNLHQSTSHSRATPPAPNYECPKLAVKHKNIRIVHCVLQRICCRGANTTAKIRQFLHYSSYAGPKITTRRRKSQGPSTASTTLRPCCSAQRCLRSSHTWWARFLPHT